MHESLLPTLKRGAIAGGAGVGLLALVSTWVSTEAPETAAGTATAVSNPPPPVVLEPASPVVTPPAPDASAATAPADPTMEPPPTRPPSFVPPVVPPAATAATERSMAAPSRPSSSAQAAPAPSAPDAGRGGPTPTIASGPPATNPRPKVATPAVQTAAYAPESLVVRFATLDDLDQLIAASDVDVLLEYADGKRFYLPRALGGSSRALPVGSAEFQAMVAAGGVTELTPGPDLRARVGLNTTSVRFLAVLGPRLRAMVAQELGDDPSPRTVTISAGPRVESRVAHR